MTNENTELAGRFICFTLGNEKFAIPLSQVKEVIGNIEITPVPHSPDYYEGIMNLRGQIIPVIDLRTKLAIKKGTSKEMTIIILDFDSETHSLGVIVDSVDAVNSFEAEDISKIEESVFFMKSEYVLGVAKSEKGLTMILQLKAVLHGVDYPAVESVVAEAS